MYILAMFYLRRRKISLGEYTFWGLFALFVPALGPFLVIISRPGNIKHNGHEGEKVYRMQLTLCDPLWPSRLFFRR
ncbi:MAG: hypothetical protein Q8N45_10455, partial [Anaerolineales bacterium]|nr:hypothetical protein [Anaerolineales bacterium]